MYVWPYGSYTLFPSSNQLFPLGTEAPRALLSRGKHDIIKLSSSLSLSFSLSFLRCIYLPFSVSPLLFFISLPPSSPHPSSPRAEQSRAEQSRAEQSRALQRYYRMHMVQNQNPSQASPGLFSYASSSLLVQAEFIQRQDEPRPNSH